MLRTHLSGEKVHFAQFRGILLNFVQDATSQKTNERVRQAAGVRLSVDSRRPPASSPTMSNSPTDSEELKTAMLKCITNTKYNDLEDFVNWLNEPSTNASQPHTKSHSLEDQANRISLQRATKADELSPRHLQSTRTMSESEVR